MNTAGRLVARRQTGGLLLVAIIATMLLSACSGGMDFTEPAPTPTIGSTSAIASSTPLPIQATQTAEVSDVPYSIERIVLSTEVNQEGAPLNEVSVLSQEQQHIYLAVRVRDIPENSQFQALWRENDEVIGQSDVRVDRPETGSQWIALQFRSIANLNPAASHSVELIINDRSVNTFAFRVGVGNAEDIIAEATFARGVDDDGQPVDPDETFSRQEEQIVLVTRISNRVDPTGMIFTAQWFRGTVPLAQGTPDGGQPRLGIDIDDRQGRTMSFTLNPQSSLVPGEYSVALHLNGRQIAEYEFSILPDDAVDENRTPTPEPTPTPVDPDVAVLNVIVARGVDDDSSEPDDEITNIEAQATETLALFIAIEMEHLQVEDSVEVIVGIGNSVIDRYQLPVAAMERGWMAIEASFRAPDFVDRSVTYEVGIYIDGSWSGGTTFDVEATSAAPAPTPTPDPFDLRSGDDDDDNDEDEEDDEDD